MPSLSLKTYPFANVEIASVFSAYPNNVRDRLLYLRQLIFATAEKNHGVGPLTETLRWKQPTYLTEQSKSGSMIRIDQIKQHEGRVGLFFHCQTSLVDTMRDRYADLFRFDGSRCLYFDRDDNVIETELCECIRLALTYRLSSARKH